MSAFRNQKVHWFLGWLGVVCLISISGCGSGEIDKFADIQVLSDYRVDWLDIRIFLLDENGRALIWNQSILSPEIGLSTINESEFTTNAKIYSMRRGERGIKVYDGRLLDLRWSRVVGSRARLLRAEIPRALIDEDPERDTEVGFITVTVQTDRQGPFSDTDEKTQIYSSFR
jgi:hypothetical protein